MIFKNWFRKEECDMQWNELNILPEDNKVLLLYVKRDGVEEGQDTIATGKFNIAKGWSIGLSGAFEPLSRDYSVAKWMEIPLP